MTGERHDEQMAGFGHGPSYQGKARKKPPRVCHGLRRNAHAKATDSMSAVSATDHPSLSALSRLRAIPAHPEAAARSDLMLSRQAAFGRNSLKSEYQPATLSV
jgi:hypothetical protein